MYKQIVFAINALIFASSAAFAGMSSYEGEWKRTDSIDGKFLQTTLKFDSTANTISVYQEGRTLFELKECSIITINIPIVGLKAIVEAYLGENINDVADCENGNTVLALKINSSGTLSISILSDGEGWTLSLFGLTKDTQL